MVGNNKNMSNFTAWKNPYIIGRPIHESSKFFGRESLFHFIEDNLRTNKRVILLHAQRRIGMSSALQQIPHKVAQDKFVFVFFDLQGHSDSYLSNILHNLAEEITDTITETLSLDSDIITVPSEEELKNNPDIFSDEFLPQIYHELDYKNLVLLLDEFDVVSNNKDNIANEGATFFPYLKSLLTQQEKLFIIPVVGRSNNDWQNLLQLFKGAPFQEVGLLDDISAKRLITQPAEGMLEYEEDAIKAILELSAGHPYFTQVICFNLFLQAKIEEKLTVTRSDVQSIVEKTIESASGGLAWFWDGQSISEKVVLSAVAEAQKIAHEQNKSFPEDPLALLKKYGVILTEELVKAVDNLTSNDFLDDTKHRIKIELVRRWLVERRPLSKTIWKLEEIAKEEIKKLSEEATKLYQEGKKQEAINRYEEILQINPNHFGTLPIIAERYLELENFQKGLELYTRAYKLDAIHNKEGFLLALENYANKLINQRDFLMAKIQLEKVLEIEPDRVSAKYKIREIEAEALQNQQLTIKRNLRQQQSEIASQQIQRTQFQSTQIKNTQIKNTQIRQQLILSAIATAGIIALGVGGIGIFRFYYTPAPINNIDNKYRNISRGERTLFFTIPNTNRDRGIEEFNKGNYPQAVELFKKAVINGRSDPEVLIYYNNGKARINGNTLTLAVVVPTDNAQGTAQEMLRGVAQAQNQFNANGGLDGRLLEVVIANDSNKPEEAKQIAQQLVKDKSVLGVIGHNTSDAAEAAIDVYKQASIPIISPTSGSNSLSGNVFFRTIPSNAVASEKLAEYTKKSLLNKVVIFYNPKSVYSNSLREEFERNFTGLAGQVIRKIDLTQQKLNIEQELKTDKFQKTQAIVLFPDKEYTNVALQVAKVNANKGLGLKLISGSTLYSQNTLQDGGNAIEGLVLTLPWFRDTAQTKDFSQVAQRQWGGAVSWRTASSYDATQAALNAIKASFPNPSREAVLQKLPQVNLSSRETSGFPLRFKNGERQSEPILIKVEKGQFQVLQSVN
jgi:ABC-type branched-subunit amino acid transport system substrate-binding protein